MNRNGQSLSNQAKTVEEEKEIGSTNQPEILENNSPDHRTIHFVEVPALKSEHNITQMSKQLRKTPDGNVSEKKVVEKSSTAVEKSSTAVEKSSTAVEKSSTAVEKSSTAVEKSSTAVEKFNEKAFQSVHNIDQNTTQQRKAAEKEVVNKNVLVPDEKKPAGIEGDSNEEYFNDTDYFNETDFKSAHNISQKPGKLFVEPMVYGEIAGKLVELADVGGELNRMNHESEPSEMEKAAAPEKHSILWTNHVAVLLPKTKSNGTEKNDVKNSKQVKVAGAR